jgi:hypothetical protein
MVCRYSINVYIVADHLSPEVNQETPDLSNTLNENSLVDSLHKKLIEDQKSFENGQDSSSYSPDTPKGNLEQTNENTNSDDNKVNLTKNNHFCIGSTNLNQIIRPEPYQS